MNAPSPVLKRAALAIDQARVFLAEARSAPPVDAAVAKASTFVVLVHGEADVEKSLWGSPAGKRHLAKRIVAAIPKHRTYVEPFAGGVQVFWAKEPSEVEVLADRDPDIAFAFRFVKGLTPAKLARLERKSWVGDAERFKRLLESKPEDDVERFYRFAYLAHFSFNKLRRGTMPDKHVGVEARFIERLEKLAPRLKDVIVRCADYEDVLDEFDAPDTFFFLDPPYPGYEAEVGHDDWDEARFGKALRRLEGCFLVTYGTRSDSEALFKGFHVERWRHTSGVGAHQGQGLRKSITIVATNYRLKKSVEEDGQMELPSIVGAAEVQKTIWGSPAGKKRLAARLVKLIPPHKVYVEPFAGSAAVFFEKEPVETEVLGDADPEIAAAFKAIKSLTDDELEALRKKRWVGSERAFKQLIDARPRSKVEKLYRFLYLSHFSYGKLRGKSFNPNAEGVEARTIERIEQHRERLRAATIRHAHYADLVREFDGPDTFFFLDPPYPGHNVEVGEDTFDEVEFRKVLEGIKGRFLVTYGTRWQLDTKGFHVRKIRPPRSIRAMRGVGGPKTLPQLLIANYAITEKALGAGDDAWALDEIEGVLDVHESLADDLDRARVLAGALAKAHETPEVAALARELARLEPSTAAGAAGLALELADIGASLVPALAEAAPSVAEALRRAAEPLHELAKSQWSRAYINDLPDSAFLYVEPGGEKDDQGKTVPRSLRHFPVRNHLGELDVPHLRNALARLPQSTAPGLTDARRRELESEARRLLEEAASDVEKARLIPFQQWGGSAKYARRLAAELPAHERYVEPFCGAAAVFFAKERVADEVLADADPEVVFALRYIQKLDARSFAALERFSWRVSRTGFERAKAAKPASDAERFWKHVYGRLCTWGAKPNMSGFATIHDGQTYDLEDLWRFHERLQGVRILEQDWRKTLADCDSEGTLFFIDPPYAGEWAMDDDGIPPEEVARAVAKLKGQFVVAYTDSADARKALAGVGRAFKMRIPEGRGAGQWQKRSRLFVASFDVRKHDDIKALDEAASLGERLVVGPLAKRIPLLKTSEERYVLGIVLEPERVDAQQDIYSAAEVREATHRFMEEYRNLGLMHREILGEQVKILESYLAPTEFEVDGTRIKPGTWLLAVRVVDDELWRQVKAGELTGVSIGGSAIRAPAR
jgi:DNA adenine methylase